MKNKFRQNICGIKYLKPINGCCTFVNICSFGKRINSPSLIIEPRSFRSLYSFDVSYALQKGNTHTHTHTHARKQNMQPIVINNIVTHQQSTAEHKRRECCMPKGREGGGEKHIPTCALPAQW
jgi:ribosomal protein RSM22 (predicted rRNA methylase)